MHVDTMGGAHFFKPGHGLACRLALLAAVMAALFLPVLMPAGARAAAVVAQVDLTRQRMIVKVNGVQRYSWPVSTGRKGFVTPTGTYRPQRMHRTYFSRKYYNSPMPYSIFFRGGYAIHGSNAIGQLGRTASHGCVRLSPSNAEKLFALVQNHGAGNTLIRISR